MPGEGAASEGADASGSYRFRRPTIEDGPAIWRLVVDTGVLDRNSSYAYLLLCRDFSETSVLAEREGSLLGFVTAYRPPARAEVLFVWQVGVAQAARGEGLASTLLDRLLHAPGCRGVRYLETTVTPSNTASRALFGALARRLDTQLEESDGFAAELFPEGGHEQEPELRIGPFDLTTANDAAS
jgi:L-2,4-diaminobutyric acid acetyltransferase